MRLLFGVSNVFFGDTWKNVLDFFLVVGFGPIAVMLKQLSDREPLKFKGKAKKWAFFIDILVFGLILTMGWIHYNHYQFPDVVGQQLESAKNAVLLMSDAESRFIIADEFADDQSSYVFKTVPSKGEIVRTSTEVTLYATYHKDRIPGYIEGTYNDEDMKEVILTGITAEYKGDGLFVGDTVSKDKIKVVANFSNKTTQPVKTSEFQIDKTHIIKSGDNVFQIRYEDKETDLTIRASDPVVLEIKAEYHGITPIAGDTLDAADFTVRAVWSNKRETAVNEGDFSLSPNTVEEGDNDIKVSYVPNTAKTAVCRIKALGKGENRPVAEQEPNNSFETATLMEAPCFVSARIANTSDVDIYEMKVRESGCVKIAVDSKLNYTGLYLYDTGNTEPIWYSCDNLCDQSIGTWRKAFELPLSAGTYYLKLTGQKDLNSEICVGDYKLEITFTSANCTKLERHSNWDGAMDITEKSHINDQISITERTNFYLFTLKESSTVQMTISFYMPKWKMKLFYDENTETPILERDAERNDSIGKGTANEAFVLSPGTYRMQISCPGNGNLHEMAGNYQFDMKISPCRITERSVLNAEPTDGVVTTRETSRTHTLKLNNESNVQFSFNTSGKAKLEVWSNDGKDCLWSTWADAGESVFETYTLAKGNYQLVIKRENDAGISYTITL